MEGIIPKSDGYLPYITGSQTPRLTIYSKNGYDAAFYNYYGGNRDTIPDPVMCCSYNTFCYLRSSTPLQCSVDWGDGIKEDIEGEKLQDGTYILGWRTWNIKYNKAPGSAFISVNKEDGTMWIPRDNHIFQDGSTSSHRCVFTFNKDSNIYVYYTRLITYSSCPNIELYTLTSLTLAYLGVSELPSNRLDKLGNITSLNLENASNKLQSIPESFFNMKNLKTIDLSILVNCQNPDSSNLRRIKEWRNLTSLRMVNTNIGTFIREFLELPNIEYFELGSTTPTTMTTEVENLPSGWSSIQISTYGSEVYPGAAGTDMWKSGYTNFKNLPNVIKTIRNPYSNALPYLPPYIDSLYNLTSLSFPRFISTQKRADGFIDYLFNHVTGDSNITMTSTKKDGTRNQFYGLTVYLYGSDHTQWKRPSGTIQAPDGFVKGSSNGNPATPCEEIYALVNNYNMTISIGPAATTRSSLSDSINYINEVSEYSCPFNQDTKFKAFLSSNELKYVDIEFTRVEIVSQAESFDEIIFESKEDGIEKLTNLGIDDLSLLYTFFEDRENGISQLINEQASNNL